MSVFNCARSALTVALVCPRSARELCAIRVDRRESRFACAPDGSPGVGLELLGVGDQEVVPDGRVRLQLGDVRLHGGQRIGVGQRHRYGEHPGDQPMRGTT